MVSKRATVLTEAPTVSDCPRGYPMLARFTASAPEFYIFREFRYLQSRLLLHLQDEIRALEAQLWRMDEKDKVNDPHSLECRELDDKLNGRRNIIMRQIQEKLIQYGKCNVQRCDPCTYMLSEKSAGELLCLSGKLAALERPSKFETASVLNFFLHNRPIASHENYIGNTCDLVTLKSSRDDSWLDRQILKLLVRANTPLLSVSSVCVPMS